MAEAIRFEATPHQLALITSEAREVLLSGGYGSGKSVAVCLKLAARASVPGSREALIRKTFTSLRRTTMQTLLEGDGDVPPILPPEAIDWNKSEGIVRIRGGGTILMLGCDEPTRIGSLNLTGCGVDEAAELSADEWRMIKGRVRVTVDGLQPQLYAATNPDGPRHHLAQRFGLDGVSAPLPGCEAYAVRTDQNRYLPADYIADMGRMVGADRARFFEGRWVQPSGMVYPFNAEVHVRAGDAEFARVVCGVDAGVKDAETLVVVGIRADGSLHVPETSYATGQTLDDTLATAHRLRERWGVSQFAVDPSALRLREHLASDGLNVNKADNAILDGVRVVQRYLAIDGQGVPRLTIDPSCTELIRELESLTWNEKTGKPRDGDDHAADALRYGVMAADLPAQEVYIGGDWLDAEVETDSTRNNDPEPRPFEHAGDWQLVCGEVWDDD